MDNLKKYLREQRESLDVDAPSDAVWERIAMQRPAPATRIVPMILRFAAAACIIAFVAGGVFYFNKKDTGLQNHVTADVKKAPAADTPKIIPATNTDIIDAVQASPDNDLAVNKKNVQPEKKYLPVKKRSVPRISPDEIIVRDLQSNYAQLVNMQVSRLNKMPVYAVSPGYFNSFKDQLKTLDSNEVSLRSEIKKYGLNDELLQQLININQQKLNVLRTLQSEINKINNRVIGSHPLQDSVKASYLNI